MFLSSSHTATILILSPTIYNLPRLYVCAYVHMRICKTLLNIPPIACIFPHRFIPQPDAHVQRPRRVLLASLGPSWGGRIRPCQDRRGHSHARVEPPKPRRRLRRVGAFFGFFGPESPRRHHMVGGRVGGRVRGGPQCGQCATGCVPIFALKGDVSGSLRNCGYSVLARADRTIHDEFGRAVDTAP